MGSEDVFGAAKDVLPGAPALGMAIRHVVIEPRSEAFSDVGNGLVFRIVQRSVAADRHRPVGGFAHPEFVVWQGGFQQAADVLSCQHPALVRSLLQMGVLGIGAQALDFSRMGRRRLIFLRLLFSTARFGMSVQLRNFLRLSLGLVVEDRPLHAVQNALGQHPADTPAGEDDVKTRIAPRSNEAASKASDRLGTRRAMDRIHDAPASVVQDGADAGAHGDSRVFGHADLLLFMSLQLSSPGSGPDWRGKGDASAAVPQASAEDTTPCGDR
ncbi:hypothetical protein GFGA_2d0090 (plasmid) [Gluconobacter frateurii NBRC 103465]|nr:hypothetical protein GFGA_2d0090 [Gluconobacter frateurii NBRC 103465]